MPTNWTNVPLSAATARVNVQSYEFLKQFWQAVAERAWLAGLCNWPRGSHVWESGTVPSGITETSFTDSTKTWCGGTDDVSGLSYDNPWACVTSGPATDYFPDNWYLVIDDNDPDVVVKTPITSWSNTGQLNFSNIRDFATSKQIPSIASLIGKPYYIIGYTYALAWAERVLEWPNSYEYVTGTVQSLAAGSNTALYPASPTNTLLRDELRHWHPNEHAGRDLLYYDDSSPSFLKRVSITSNTASILYFASQTSIASIGSAYVVVGASNRAYPGRDPVYPFTFYRGRAANYQTHAPADTLAAASMPAATVKVPGPVTGSPGECGDIPELVWDTDYWTDFPLSDDQLACGTPPEKPYAKGLFKTLRGLQLALEALSFSYVEDKDYDGAAAIPFINPAEMWKLAAAAQAAASATATIQTFTGTTGDVEGASGNDGTANNAIAVSGVTMPYIPIQVWYSIHSASGEYKAGRGVMTANNRLLDEPEGAGFNQEYDAPDPDVPGDNGRTIVIAPGWSRFVPRQFKRMFNHAGIFIPDTVTDPDTLVVSAVDPAAVVSFADSQCLGIGTFVQRSKSTTYIERKQEVQGYTSAQGFAWEDGDAFGASNIARYVGDNYADPTVADSTSSLDSTAHFFGDDADTTLAPYYERFYVGRSSPSVQGANDGQRFGTGTDGGTFWIRDTTKAFFDHHWFGGAAMRVEAGTATAGSTTGLSDSTKADADPDSPTNELNCFWHAERFRDFAGPYVGFTVEVDFTSGTNTTTHRRLITAGTGASASISWSEPLPASASGKVYRIKEPYSLNRFRDRTIWLTPTSTNGVQLNPSFSGTVTGNADDVIFFATSSTNFGGATNLANVSTNNTDASFFQTNLAGWRYGVIEPAVGTTWKWNGTASTWTVPTGADIVRTSVTAAANFHAGQTENLPYYQKRYGRFMHGDALSSEVFDELYWVLKVLQAAKLSVYWTTRADDATPENNAETESSGTVDEPIGDGSIAHAAANALWGTGQVEGASVPRAVCFQSQTYGAGIPPPPTGPGNCTLDRAYAYAVVTLCGRQTVGIDYFAFALANDGAGAAVMESDTLTSNVHHVVSFDDQGDQVLYNAWSLFTGGSSSGTSARGMLGSTGAPTGDLPAPVYNMSIDEAISEASGYVVTDQCAVVHGTGFLFK